MPSTAKSVAKSLGVIGELNLLNPEINIPLGVAYILQLTNEFSLPEAIASYNAGENAVRKWKGLRKDLDYDVFVEEIPYTETRKYVKKVLARMWIYSKFGK